MAKFILREMSDVRKTGKRQVYPKLVVHDTLDTEHFIHEVQKHISGMSRGVLQGAITAISEALVCVLSEGNNVTIDGIGTFSTSLKFIDGKPDEIQGDDDRLLYRYVGVKNVNFRPSPYLMHELRMKTRFERMMSGVKALKKNRFTPEERLKNALKIIDAKGYMTLSEYAHANNLSRTVACTELAAITSDTTSQITTSGQGSHKVWVRRG